ncbi:class I histocompatibility antigen, F10 alpha chain [Paramisgurnus dabryanus]|uniref:class I histocompatibility antigen, F10 alpha chain n=1 Tax=Paramisgurnus dabryanus TaxID=90735 RepID=UPI0031F40A02
MLSLFFFLLVLYEANGGTHSFKAFYTATTGINGFSEFTVISAVDDVLTAYYDSFTKQYVPRTDWMRETEGPDYWKQQTDVCVGTEQSFKNNLQVAMGRFNQSGGIHTFQRMYGCSWDDDTGEVDGFKEYGYDGEDLISLDLKNLQYVTTLPQGVITQVKWNNDKAQLENDKQYYSQICIEWLKKYLQYGKSALMREVSPQVSLLQKDSSSPVTCHATGFYPEQVAISWLKNDEEHHEDVELGELVPNEDGTYQKTSTLNVKPEEWKNNQFKCVVEHKGKAIRTIVTEDEIRTNNGNVPVALIVGVIVAVVLLVVAGIVGFKIYQKKKGFKPVNTSDGGSNSSSSQTGP